MELVYIEWEDASAVDEPGWVDRGTAHTPPKHIFRQVGFVVDVDLEALILTEAHTDTHMAPRTRIPMGMIRRWVDLDEHVKAGT